MRKFLICLLALWLPNSFADLVHGQDTAGNRPPIRTTTDGQTVTSLGECEDVTLNHCRVSLAGGGSVQISSATSTQVKASAGEVVGFYVNSTSSGTIRFYDDGDGTCSSGDKGGVITPAVGWHFYPVPFTTAICALTASTINVTVVYK